MPAITLDAFLAYFTTYALMRSAIFADPRTGALTGIIDYHADPDDPAWGDHRVTFKPVPSPEWTAWAKNQHAMGQFEFCEFIEDRLADIVEPDGASMLEAVANLKAQRKVEFASKVDNHSGSVVFSFSSETKGKGQVQLPEAFKIGVPPFEGSDRFEIEARLRYRISDEGGLTIWYSLVRPDDAVREVVNEMIERVRAEADTDRMYLASPPAAVTPLARIGHPR